jgi:hypothetical protein
MVRPARLVSASAWLRRGVSTFPGFLANRLDDRLGPHQHPVFAEEVKPFDMDRTPMELRDDDGEIFGLAEVIFLVRDQSALFLPVAEVLRDGVFEEGVGDMFFVQGEVILHAIADGFFVLLVAFARKAFDEAAFGERFLREAGEFSDRLGAMRDRDDVTAAGEEGEADIHSAEGADTSAIGGDEFRVEEAIEDENGQPGRPRLLVCIGRHQ